MNEVTMEQFHRLVGSLNVVLSIIGDYPYTGEWRLRNGGQLKGKTVERYADADSKWPVIKTYYVSPDLIN